MTGKILSRSSRLGLAGAVVALAIPLALHAQGAAPLGTTQVADADLVQRLQTELGNQPTNASSEDLEGFIVFVVGQSDYTPETILTALNAIDGGASPALKQAIVNVRMTLLGRRLTRGTAAIRAGGFGGYGGTGGFSSPITNVPGGGSNYNT